MLNEFFLKVPYLLFFIPLMASVFVNFVQDKRFMSTMTNIILIVMMVFSLKILVNFNDFNTIYFVNSSIKFNILSTEFKISPMELIFLMCILLCNFIGFINYINEILLSKNLDSKQMKYFFSIYLIYIFSIVGIVFTYNIFNLFIFLEIYSFSIYVMISIYNKENLNIVSYKFFTNNIFGSILLAITMFYITIYFGTANIINIKQQLMTMNLVENYEVLLMFILFLFSIVVKFFLTNTSRYHNTKNVGINFLSISNIFVNVLIGIYLIYEILFFIFDSNLLFNIPLINYFIFLIAGLIIIYNSLNVILTKSNTLFNVFLRLNLINLGYILLTTICYEKDKQLATSLFMLHIFEFSLMNLFIYLFSGIVSIIYKHNNLDYLNKNKIFKIILLIVLSYKIFLPFGTSFFMNKTFIIFALKNGIIYNIMYLLPFLINKICYILLFIKILNNKNNPKDEGGIINKKYLNILYFSITLVFVLIVFFEVIFWGYVS